MCVVLAALAIPLSVIVLWATNSIDSESTFVGTLAPLATDKTVTSTVNGEVTSALLSLDSQSPVHVPSAQVRSEVDAFVDGPAFPPIWTAALRAAYPTVHALSSGQLGQGEPVVVNLTPAVDAVVSALRAQNHGNLDEFPSTAPQVAVTVVPTSRVATVSETAHDLTDLEWILPLSAVVAALAALLLARRRGIVVVGLAICTGVVSVALLSLLAALRGGMVNETHTGNGLNAASVSVFDVLSGPLRNHLYLTIAIAVVVVLGVLAWSIGRPVLARFARGRAAPRRATWVNRYRV